MNRWLIIAGVVLSAACTGSRTGVDGPAPVVATVADSLASADSASLESEFGPAPLLDVAAAVGDTQLFRALARDSLLDAEMLEQLHEVTAAPALTPEEPPGAEAEVDLAEMFDINVARYAEHARVRFYLNFFQGPARERMAVWLERLPHYEPIIRSVFQAHGIPSDLVYLGLIESGYSNTAVSRSKAVGMWQFMRPTARGFGLVVDRWVDDRRDFLKATNAAARYLAELTKRFNGSHYLAAAAYNGGAGRVSRGLRKLGAVVELDDEELEEEGDSVETFEDDRFFQLSGSRYIHRETKDYVPKLIAAAMIAKQPERYGFKPIPKVDPYSIDSVPITEATSLEVVARASGTPVREVLFLNPHFIRGITPPGRLAWVRVPSGKGVATTEALAAIPSSERVPAMIHVVARRETMKSIARRYGITQQQLIKFNPGLTSANVTPGLTLRVPGTARVRSLVVDDQRESAGRSARVRAGGVHRVRKGETLSGIAARYGVSISRLASWNGISRSSKLRIGQRLVVSRVVSSRAAGSASRQRIASSGRSSGGRPNGAGVHLVRRGETLSALARRYGVSVAALMAANGLRSATDLKAGTRITIPT